MSKCDLNKHELAFLGHLVGRDGIKVDPRKVAAVEQWPRPPDVRNLRSWVWPTTSGGSCWGTLS